MPRKQVLVQLDDELVDRLDEIANACGTSRSDLLRRGARAVIAAEDAALADAQLTEAYRSAPADVALLDSATRLAARTVPEW